MSVITFDTLKFSQRLEKAGATREYADAYTKALAETLSAGTQELATKGDLREPNAELMREMKLNRWMMAAVIGLSIATLAKQNF